MCIVNDNLKSNLWDSRVKYMKKNKINVYFYYGDIYCKKKFKMSKQELWLTVNLWNSNKSNVNVTFDQSLNVSLTFFLNRIRGKHNIYVQQPI